MVNALSRPVHLSLIAFWLALAGPVPATATALDVQILEQNCHCPSAAAPVGGLKTVRIEMDDQPDLARAFLAWARSIDPDAALPLRLVATPDMEPLVLVRSSEELQVAADRWRRDRDALIAEAGLHLRRQKLAGTFPRSVVEDTPAARIIEARWLMRSTNDADRKKAFEVLRGVLHSGAYDAIGGGVFRRLRDEAWSMPHFEKLLADQAQAALAFTAAWQMTRDPEFEQAALATAESIARDFRDVTSGGLAHGLGASSLVARQGPERLEGGAYTWTADEIRTVLDRPTADLVTFAHGMTNEGNIDSTFDPRGDFRGRNMVRPQRPLSEIKTRFGLSEAEIDEKIGRARETLLAVRIRRPPPTLDPRSITESTALAISALARAGGAFGIDRWITVAAQQARGLLSARRLVRRTGVEASVDDYAALIAALMDVYEVTFDLRFLDRAIALQDEQDRRFGLDIDVAQEIAVPQTLRGLALLPDSTPRLVGQNLARLAEIRNSASLRERAASLGAAKSRLVVVTRGIDDEVFAQWIATLRNSYARDWMVFAISGKSATADLVKRMPFARIEPIEKKSALTVCEAGTCRTPTTDFARAMAWLE